MTRESLFSLALAILALGASAKAQSITLGSTASTFSVLAGSTVTNTGATVITGNVGVSPGGAITGLAAVPNPPAPGSVIGTIHSNDAVAILAQSQLTTAYNSVAALAATTNLTGQNLGGLTLNPGVYSFATAAQLTGVLTLNTGGNPNAPFYFQIGSTLTTAAASAIVTLGLGGGTDPNIFFQVGSSATLGAGTTFLGNILAQGSITLDALASIQGGRALSRTGAVTLIDNAISNVTIPSVIAPAPVAAVVVAPTPTLVAMVAVTIGGIPVAVIPVQLSFQDIPGLSPDEESVASALDKLAIRDPGSPLIAALDTVKRPGLAARYDLLSPAQFAAIFDAGFASAQLQTGEIERRLEALRDGSADYDASLNDTRSTLSAPDAKDGKRMLDNSGKIAIDTTPNRRWGFYISGTGEWTDIQSTSNAAGSDITTGAATVGADYRVTDHFAIGLTGGYENTTFGGVGNGRIDRDTGEANAYATWYDHGFYLNGIIGGGYSSYLTRRETIGGAARGDTDGLDYTGTIGAGYEYRVGGLTVGPIAAVQYTTIGLKGFTERGSLAPLHLDDESGSSLLSEVGIRASYAWKVGRAVITPEARAQWLHEYQDSSQGIGASFAENSTASFNVYGPQIGRDSLLLEVGLSAQLSPRTSVFAYYTGDFGAANYTSHSVNGGFRISF